MRILVRLDFCLIQVPLGVVVQYDPCILEKTYEVFFTLTCAMFKGETERVLKNLFEKEQTRTSCINSQTHVPSRRV
jgi:hypothetical protein